MGAAHTAFLVKLVPKVIVRNEANETYFNIPLFNIHLTTS